VRPICRKSPSQTFLSIPLFPPFIHPLTRISVPLKPSPIRFSRAPVPRQRPSCFVTLLRSASFAKRGITAHLRSPKIPLFSLAIFPPLQSKIMALDGFLWNPLRGPGGFVSFPVLSSLLSARSKDEKYCSCLPIHFFKVHRSFFIPCSPCLRYAPRNQVFIPPPLPSPL